MKTFRPKIYVYAVLAVVVAIAILLYYFFFTEFSKQSNTEYIYIDADDTTDSVVVKLEKVGKSHAVNAFSNMARHFGYDGDKIRTGRYAVEPGESTFSL